MLEERFHCDGPQCEKTTLKSNPLPTWKVSLWLTTHMRRQAGVPMGSADVRESHYCSVLCEHNATYIESHADAGK